MPPRCVLVPALTGAVLLTTGLAVGLSLRGPAAAPVSPQAAAPSPVAARWSGRDLAPATSCEDLLGWYVDRAEDLVTPWGWDTGGWAYAAQDGLDSARLVSARAAAPVELSAATGMTKAEASATGTNVQEAGVDEPDVAKTDGSLLVRIDDGDLVVDDVSGSDVEGLSRTDLPDVIDPELLLVGSTDHRVVVVIGADREAPRRTPGTRLLRVDLADPSSPVVTDTVSIDSESLAVRSTGSTVRLVVRTGLPDLDFASPGRSRPSARRDAEQEALKHNKRLVRRTEVTDWLPQVTTYAGDGTSTTRPLVDCADVALPDDPDDAEGTDPGSVSIVGLDATSGLDGLEPADVAAVAVGTDLVYVSTDRLYLATTPTTWGCCWGLPAIASRGPGVAADDDGRSRIHEFVLDGTTATYVASGVVDGTIRDRWAMDEQDGVLRVVVGASHETGDSSSLVTLSSADSPQGDRLEEVGRVDGIGPREDVQAVRWFGDLALVVTFRRVDPLHVVDLSDPAHPVVVGELRVPGFSSYLHPLGPRRLLGFGEGPAGRGWGAQAGLFDLEHLDAPRRLGSVSFGNGTRAVVSGEPRALTWLPGERTALTVVTRGWSDRTGKVMAIRLDDGRVTARSLGVVHGDEVDASRFLRLPDKRVVLVTGDDARMLLDPRIRPTNEG